MSLKTALVLALLIVSGTFGDTMLSKGMKQVGELTSTHPAELLRFILRAVRNPYVIMGVLGLAVYFFSFMAILSWADVSLVVPITALSFLLTTFVAERALGEHVSPQRWLGTVLIVLGVILVARSQAPGTRSSRSDPIFRPESAGGAKNAKSEGTRKQGETQRATETRGRMGLTSLSETQAYCPAAPFFG